MAAISTCPDEHELLPIALGEPAEEAIAEHLDACPNCRERVDRLRAEATEMRHHLGGEVAGGPVPAPCEDRALSRWT